MSTNSTYQIKKLEEARLSDAQQKLYAFALVNDAATYKEASAATGLSLSSVCGRFNELAELGMMWNEKHPKGPATLHATDSETDMRRNVYLFNAEKDKKAFSDLRKNLNWLRSRGKIHGGDIQVLRPIISRINKLV